MFRLSQHFTLEEFTNDNEKPNERALANLFALANELEIVRRLLGDHPITITSGLRSPSRNAAVGGVSNSQHLVGQAADFQHQTISPHGILEILTAKRAHLKIDQLIRYKTHVHLSIAEKPRGSFFNAPGLNP